MSRREDGSIRCDRDGTDVGNGGVDLAITVSDQVIDGQGYPAPRVLHFCRENGCDRKVLSTRNLANYREAHP